MLCEGESAKIYRCGAKRWTKFRFHKNHKFSAKRFSSTASCNFCGEKIWGLGVHGYKCVECRIKLHKTCLTYLTFQCGEVPVREFQPAFNETTKNSDDFLRVPTLNANPQIGLEQFDLLRVLGRGNYANVLQVRHKSDSQIYAMKVIEKQSMTHDEDIEAVFVEKNVFKIVTKKCPFLVGMHSCFQTVSRIFFVIDFINGGDLMYHMQRSEKLPEQHVQFYAAEISLGLRFLHRHGIIYRDLKLDNVLMDREGHLKLTDFGLCKQGMFDGQKTNTFCGTPNYIAPEILRNESYGMSVDWWSLGVVIYEMVTGASPWIDRTFLLSDDHSEERLFKIILNRPIRIPRQISNQTSSIITGLMNKNPNDRIAVEPHSSFAEFKCHIFFRDIDWEKLENRSTAPPFKPKITDELDSSNFDPTFTTQAVYFKPDYEFNNKFVDQSEFNDFDFINYEH